MRTITTGLFVFFVVCFSGAGQDRPANAGQERLTAHSRGLHGYIGFSAAVPPERSEFSAGMGFYSAVWPLIDRPLANFQIGLAGSYLWCRPKGSRQAMCRS